MVLLGFSALLQQVLSNVCIRFEPYLIKTKNIAHHIPHQTFQVNETASRNLWPGMINFVSNLLRILTKQRKVLIALTLMLLSTSKKPLLTLESFGGKESLLSLIRRRLTFKSREHKIAFGLLNFLKEKRLLFQKSKENKKQGLHFKKRERFFQNHSIY